MKYKDPKTDGPDTGEYAIKRSYSADIVAFVVCVCLGLFVWLCIMHASDTTYLTLCVEGGESDYVYELSANEMKVEGSVLSLKRATEIAVKIPDDALTPGVHTLTADNLIFPAGVTPVGTPAITLTVTPKQP